jgi:hypothetical protein
MPIRRYMQERAVFSPQALSAMSKALTDTVEILGIGRDEAKRRDVARFLIRLMQEDGSLDAITMRDSAVALGRCRLLRPSRARSPLIMAGAPSWPRSAGFFITAKPAFSRRPWLNRRPSLRRLGGALSDLGDRCTDPRANQSPVAPAHALPGRGSWP